MLGNQAAVAGIGQTAFGKSLERDELDLACEAIQLACEDAGVPLRSVDGAVSYHIEQVVETDLVSTLGLTGLTYFARTPSGGGGAASTVALAATAVATGMAKRVIAFRSRNRGKRSAYGADPNQGGRPWAKAGTILRDHRMWHHPFGVAAPAQEMALMARRHMHVYGTRAEHFGMQAVVQRDYASRNPNAIMRNPITLDDWANARVIAEPIHLVDCSLENDGAVAYLVTSAEEARDLAQPPAYVLGAAIGGGPIHTELAEFFRTTGAYDPDRIIGGRLIARELFGGAGITPADVDAAMIFDHFTMAVPLSLEQYGFCPPGEGGPFIEAGNTRLGGALPVNTHGGSNGEAFIHGANHVNEAVRQIRGTSTSQVDGCEVSFVCGSITDPAGAVLLAREEAS